ncbi:hypothetical protein BDV59DRAFT_198701 [Aspergillus ambiguus]|uniref:uncharacterized protein n=1 Tax=Aspergillus ambiguus TaxID=176160 RepID=UPI003CCDE267
MGVGTTVKYVFGLSFLPRRHFRKGKQADHRTAPIAVTVHCHNGSCDDDGPDFETDFGSGCSFAAQMAVKETALGLHHHHDAAGSGGSSSSSRARLARIVSWASIVGDRNRWTMEQERELAIAESQLARCQKAWSSEQELWLAYIKALTEEKEAHEEFLQHRAKQQDDEQQHFRKAWSRRKSYEDQQQHPGRANSRLRRLRRRTSSFGPED